MPTIMDVAKLAGVSRTTVSRVLNDKPRVDEQTRKKVLAAIEQLNYEPSHFARHLRKQETRLIAVLVPDISNPFFSRLLEGMEEVALERGYKILLCITGDRKEREMQYIRMLESRQVDGIILTALRNPIDSLVPYMQFGPIVFVNEYVDGDCIPSVAIDNTASAAMVVRHLIALGHRRIAFINGPEHIIICRDRKAGYRKALESIGLPVDDQLMRECDYTTEGGFRCTQQLFELADPPTAIFAANDTIAVGVIKALRRQGLQVPRQVMVAGFDNNPFSTVIEPNLTTVEQPTHLMGAEAVKLLIKCLDIGRDKVKFRRILFETKLYIRESSTASE